MPQYSFWLDGDGNYVAHRIPLYTRGPERAGCVFKKDAQAPVFSSIGGGGDADAVIHAAFDVLATGDQMQAKRSRFHPKR